LEIKNRVFKKKEKMYKKTRKNKKHDYNPQSICCFATYLF
jgi:hypothetical protein